MRQLSFIVALVLGLAISAAHAGSFPDPYQLVGFTSATFPGNGGVRTFTQACQADFGAAARMCESAEVLKTVVWPTSLTGTAWVMPTFVPGDTTLDASGVANNAASLTCAAWSYNGNNQSGLHVDANGVMSSSADCSVARSVACCMPVRLPKPRK
jgi:hypothetical protein